MPQSARKTATVPSVLGHSPGGAADRREFNSMVPLHTQQQISTQSQSQDKTTYSINSGMACAAWSGTKGGLVDDPESPCRLSPKSGAWPHLSSTTYAHSAFHAEDRSGRF